MGLVENLVLAGGYLSFAALILALQIAQPAATAMRFALNNTIFNHTDAASRSGFRVN